MTTTNPLDEELPAPQPPALDLQAQIAQGMSLWAETRLRPALEAQTAQVEALVARRLQELETKLPSLESVAQATVLLLRSQAQQQRDAQEAQQAQQAQQHIAQLQQAQTSLAAQPAEQPDPAGPAQTTWQRTTAELKERPVESIMTIIDYVLEAGLKVLPHLAALRDPFLFAQRLKTAEPLKAAFVAQFMGYEPLAQQIPLLMLHAGSNAFAAGVRARQLGSQAVSSSPPAAPAMPGSPLGPSPATIPATIPAVYHPQLPPGSAVMSQGALYYNPFPNETSSMPGEHWPPPENRNGSSNNSSSNKNGLLNGSGERMPGAGGFERLAKQLRQSQTA